METVTDRQASRKKYKQTDRHPGRQTGTQADRQVSRQTDRQTDSHPGTQTGIQADRQAGRQNRQSCTSLSALFSQAKLH